jgi:hypothetical protein
MDSLDAQCFLIDLVAHEMPAPELWHHSLAGELSCAYSTGEQTFTWRPDDVAAMARAWRESPARPAPERARPFIDAHRQLAGMLARAGREPADAIVHDFERRELRAKWEEQKVVVVIEIPAPALRAAVGDPPSS